jgi:CRISPR-associated protein Csh1
MILPYTNSAEVREELRLSLLKHPDHYQLSQGHDLIAEEFDLLRDFGHRGDQLAFSLIFFEKENAAWRIQAEIQEVLPSRMNALYKAGKIIEKAQDLSPETKIKSEGLRITANTFKQFAGIRKPTSAHTLRAWLAALFEGRTINYRHFLHQLVNSLISTGKSKPDSLCWMTRQAWGLYRYARQVHLISPPNAAMEADIMQEIIPHSAYGRYIQEHSDFFCRPEMITAFLTGCYAAQVIAVQRKERNAAPFAKKFIGRLLSRQQLKRLYREGHSKLAQYDKLGYVIKGLDPDLATAWVVCGDGWNISDEETTFTFTIGYSLAYRIGQLFQEESSTQLENQLEQNP